MAGDMIKLGGLWSNKDRDGGTFLTGKLSPGVKILIFKNKYREAENQPTHILYLAPVEQQQQGQRDADQADEFFDDAAFQRGQQRTAQSGYQAPEDVPLPAEEYTTVRRSQPQQARPSRQPAPPPDYDQDDIDDPFADQAAPAPVRQPRSGTGRNAPF